MHIFPADDMAPDRVPVTFTPSPPRSSDDIVLHTSPRAIRQVLEHEGVPRIRALLQKSPLEACPARAAELLFNLTGEGMHTWEEIRQQMGLTEALVARYRGEMEEHLGRLLGTPVDGDGQGGGQAHGENGNAPHAA
ncbi:MAG: hypothetical protein PHI23_03555 [Candidatus Peribacteraceae bacterium]|nr:hypothetical protein [Candidatus Peribacteraceae bacterium]